MKRIIAWSVSIVCALAVSAFGQNKVVFDNKSGEPALVKLIGPTQTEVEVANGAKVGADAAAGRYIIKVRYGTPEKYYYAKGQEFEVAETATTRSETTITLHKVVSGNYDSMPISEKEFADGGRQVSATVKETRDVSRPPEGTNLSSNKVHSPTGENAVRIFRTDEQFDNLYGRTYDYVGGSVLQKASQTYGRRIHLKMRGGEMFVQGRSLGLSSVEIVLLLDYDQQKETGPEGSKPVQKAKSLMQKDFEGENRPHIVDSKGNKFSASDNSPEISFDALSYQFYIKGEYCKPLKVVLPMGTGCSAKPKD